MKNNPLWIIVEEYNDYNQHGVYFIAAFKNKPTIQMLVDLLPVNDETAQHIISGGDRRNCEDQWYLLITYPE